MAEKLEKLLDVGKKFGLEGKDLLDFIERKEQDDRALELEKLAKAEKQESDKLEREERAKEREIRKLEIESRMKEDEYKLRMIEQEVLAQKIANEKEIHLQKLKMSEDVGAMSDNVNVGIQAKVPKLPTFDDSKDNIDAYLQRFERFATYMKWKKETWATLLSALTLLKGQALEVFSRLAPDDSLDYDKLKNALLKRFEMTEEGFRTKFRSSKPIKGETSTQFVVRLENYLTRWMNLSHTELTFEGLKDLLLREQFLHG